jgi:hypothetical protein
VALDNSCELPTRDRLNAGSSRIRSIPPGSGGATRNGGDFGPEASLFSLVYDDLDLHDDLTRRIVAEATNISN